MPGERTNPSRCNQKRRSNHGSRCIHQNDGIEGESTDSNHKGWIELISYYSEMTQTVSRTASSAGGGSAERVDFDGFGFTKLLDKASPLLAHACAAGTHINTIVLELCRAGGGTS